MNKINHIKQRLSCLQYLQGRNIEVRVGKNASCPLGIHEDKNASFSIFANGEKFKCFSCGESGDVLDLAEKFGESLDDLFARTGGKTNEWQKKWKEKKEKKGEKMESFLKKRGIKSELVSSFVAEEENQICVPILDKNEEICGIQKRNLEKHEFRIDGSSGFFYSPKSENDTLILVEGMTDFLTVRQYCANVLGFVSATSWRDSEEILKKHKTILWLGDNDRAGEELKKNILGICKKQDVFSVDIGTAKDISELWQEFLPENQTKETFLAVLESKTLIYSPRKSQTVDSYTWGLDCIDRKIKTIKKGSLAVFVADSNIGKSTFCFWLARQNKRKYGHHVVYFSLESTKEEMFHNMALSSSGIEKIDERDNLHLSDPRYSAKIHKLKTEDEIEIIGRSVNDGLTIDEIEKSVYNMEKCDLLIIDNFLSIQVKEGKLSENQQAAQIMQKLIGMARDCNIPILLVHHYRKSQFKKKDEWEDLGLMYGAKQIEIFAPLIIQARRKMEAELPSEKAEFHLREGKVRGGGTREDITIFHDRGSFLEKL